MKFINNNPFLIIGIVLTTVTSFLNIGTKPLYLDEAASYAITRGFPQMIDKLWHFEGNMWLYYVLLHFWSNLGISEFSLRSLSAIFAILTVIPAYLLAKSLYTPKVANILMCILPINLLFIKNAQFARGYSLLLLLTTTSSYIMFLLQKKYSHTKFFFYILSSTLAIYTHLFGIFVLASHCVYILVIKNKTAIKIQSIALILIGILSLPILIAPSIHSSQISWITLPTLKEIIATFLYFSTDHIVILLLIFVTGVVYVNNVRSMTKIFAENRYPITLLLTPIIIAYIISYFVKPLYTVHYLSICLLPFLLLFAHSLQRLPRKVNIIIMILYVLFSMYRNFYWYTDAHTNYSVIPNNYTDWRGVNVYLAKNIKANDTVITFPTYMSIPLHYYQAITNTSYPILQLQQINLETGKGGFFDKKNLLQLPKENTRVWFVVDTDYQNDKQIYPLILSELTNKYTLQKTTRFYKSVIYLYEN